MMNRVKIAGLVIIPLMIALTSCTQKKAGSVQTSGLLITITNPVQTVFTKWDEYPGHVESIEYVELRPRVSGYIDSIHFKDGAEVKVGDLLFIVDPKPYEAELERANAELERAKSVLEQARAEKARTATQLELAKNDLNAPKDYDRLRRFQRKNMICAQRHTAVCNLLLTPRLRLFLLQNLPLAPLKHP